MRKLNYSQMAKILRLKTDGSHGVIVYLAGKSKREHRERERSYIVAPDSEFIKTGSGPLYGSTLDGTDNLVRLDKQSWKVDYCYILSPEDSAGINRRIYATARARK